MKLLTLEEAIWLHNQLMAIRESCHIRLDESNLDDQDVDHYNNSLIMIKSISEKLPNLIEGSDYRITYND